MEGGKKSIFSVSSLVAIICYYSATFVLPESSGYGAKESRIMGLLLHIVYTYFTPFSFFVPHTTHIAISVDICAHIITATLTYEHASRNKSTKLRFFRWKNIFFCYGIKGRKWEIWERKFDAVCNDFFVIFTLIDFLPFMKSFFWLSIKWKWSEKSFTLMELN